MEGEKKMIIDKYGCYHITVSVTEKAKEKIYQQSAEKDMSITDYICWIASTFQIPDSSVLKAIKIKKTKEYRNNARSYVNSLKEKNITEKEEDDDMNRKNGASLKTAQFHLRVTPETYRIIQDKAAAMAMSTSDYVTFVTTRYDIEDVNLKLDKLLAYIEEEKKNKRLLKESEGTTEEL